MRSLLKAAALIVLPLSFAACDIEPVSVGIWQVELDSPDGIQPSVWMISADGTIGMTGGTVSVVEGATLEGSRILWSDEIPNPVGQGQTLTINFSGTVDGDSLAGTLFTTSGNFSVNGTRQ